MRRLGVPIALVLLLAACGDGDPAMRVGSGDEPPAAPDRTDPVPLRVRGAVERGERGWRVCPAGQPPCWDLEGDTAGLSEASMEVEGELVGDRLRLTAEPVVIDPMRFPNPCPDAVGMGGENGDDAVVERVQGYLDTIPDQYAGSWLARPGPVFVVAVTGDAEQHRRAIDDPHVCVTDEGFRYSEAELREIQDRLFEHQEAWAANGWTVLSAGVTVIGNVVEVTFDQIDPRLQDEVADRWGDRVRALASVEVLAGTVDLLAPPPPGDDEIPIRTGPRGAGSMAALGTFTLGYDAELDCIYLQAGGDRVMPVWRFGTRALRDPVRVVDGDGNVVGEVGDRLELGGGMGLAPDAGDPLACGATESWVM